jgi:hypothetical protein
MKPLLAARMAALALLSAFALTGVGIYFATTDGPAGILRYYTTQSNLAIAAVSIADLVLLARFGKTGKKMAGIRMAAVIAIMVTGIVFAFFLSGSVRQMGPQLLASFLCHYASPTAAFLIWLAFSEKGYVSARQAWVWLVYPLAYVAYALVQGGLTGFYPYWFLNPSEPAPKGIGSLGGVAAFVAVLSAAFLLIGWAMVLADKSMAKARRGKAA